MGWKPCEVKERIRITEFFTFFRQRYTSGYHFLGESHNFWEFLYVIKGSVCVSADDKVYSLNGGSVIFHKPMEFHKFHITGGEDAELFIVSYSAEGELTEFLKDKVFSLDYKQREVVSDLMEYVSEHGRSENGMYDNYIGIFDGEGKYAQYTCLYLYRLFLMLAESESVMPVSGSPDSVVFANTVKYMNAVACDAVTVEEFAKFANVSVSKLKRIFMRYAGVGVHKYFIMIKLKKATELLGEGVSVTEVADRMGFSSQGYFSSTFKRENGYKPSEIGKTIRDSMVFPK